MAIEIVDFPIKNGDFPWQNVSSPEGTRGRGSFANHSLEMSDAFGKVRKWKDATMGTDLGLSENVVYPIVPNGFADHYPVF